MKLQSPGWRSALRALVEEVPPGEIPDLIGELARARALAEVRLRIPAQATKPASDGDRILNVQEAADMSGMSPQWVYAHSQELGGFKVGGSLRFSARNLQRYLDAKRRRK